MSNERFLCPKKISVTKLGGHGVFDDISKDSCQKGLHVAVRRLPGQFRAAAKLLLLTAAGARAGLLLEPGSVRTTINARQQLQSMAAASPALPDSA